MEDFQYYGVVREIGGDLGVGRWNGPTPRPEMVKVSAIGALGRRRDPSLDVRLDLRPERSGAINCTSRHPGQATQSVRNSRSRGVGQLDVGS